jgi:hypothetical protein
MDQKKSIAEETDQTYHYDDSHQSSDVVEASCVVSPVGSALDSTADITPASNDLISYRQLLIRARFSLSLFGAALCLFMSGFLEPILSQRLLDFKLNVRQIGLFFALFPIFYIPTCVCVHRILDWIEKRVSIALSLLVSSFAFLLCFGPSQILPPCS